MDYEVNEGDFSQFTAFLGRGHGGDMLRKYRMFLGGITGVILAFVTAF
jgi:hypothetical protein